MPIRSVTLFDAEQKIKGLYINGTKYNTPSGYFRRFKGVRQLNSGALTTRHGITLLHGTSSPVHSIVRFNNIRYYGAKDALYQAGTLLQSNLSNTHWHFARMPPTTGITDYLFISGAGNMIKVSPTNIVSPWGITAPPTSLTVTNPGASVKTIDNMESAATWTAVNATLTDEATVKVQGTNSMKVAVLQGDIGTATKSITVDLSLFADSTEPSPDEDWIEVWIGMTDPKDVAHIEIAFSIGATTFANNVFSRAIYLSRETTPYLSPSDVQRRGVADFEDAFSNQSRIVEEEFLSTPTDKIRMQEYIGNTTIAAVRNILTQLRLPKSSFRRSGSSATLGWADVQAVRLTVVANNIGSANVFFDQLRMHGRVGHQGDYTYAYTHYNDDTGTRSNPSPMTTYGRAAREVLSLAAISVSTDTQVDTREVWRTMGNGTILFRIVTLPNNTATTFSDTVADFYVLDSSGINPLMENLELPLDNDPPLSTFHDVMYDQLAFWTVGSGASTGAIYFSHPDRHEVFDGFLDITDTDNPMQRLAKYGGRRYAFSISHVHEIIGDTIFIPRLVENIPGIPASKIHTLAELPDGLIWHATDGLRVFDGTRAELLGDERIGDIMRGLTAEGIAPFSGICGAYGRSEYLISDGTVTLALNTQSGQIRSLGYGCTSLYYETDTDTWLAGRPSGLYTIEDPTKNTDDGAAIQYEIEPPSIEMDPTTGSHVSYLYIRANTQGQQVTPTLLLGDQELSLTPFTTDSDTTVEYTLGKIGSAVGVRLSGTATLPITLTKIWFDLYTPERSA